MNIILNDGTYAMNVSVDEYEALKSKGLVGKTATTDHTSPEDMKPTQCFPDDNTLKMHEESIIY